MWWLLWPPSEDEAAGLAVLPLLLLLLLLHQQSTRALAYWACKCDLAVAGESNKTSLGGTVSNCRGESSRTIPSIQSSGHQRNDCTQALRKAQWTVHHRNLGHRPQRSPCGPGRASHVRPRAGWWWHQPSRPPRGNHSRRGSIRWYQSGTSPIGVQSTYVVGATSGLHDDVESKTSGGGAATEVSTARRMLFRLPPACLNGSQTVEAVSPDRPHTRPAFEPFDK